MSDINQTRVVITPTDNGQKISIRSSGSQGPKGDPGGRGEKGEPGDSIISDPGDLTLIFDNQLI